MDTRVKEDVHFSVFHALLTAGFALSYDAHTEGPETSNVAVRALFKSVEVVVGKRHLEKSRAKSVTKIP